MNGNIQYFGRMTESDLGVFIELCHNYKVHTIEKNEIFLCVCSIN